MRVLIVGVLLLAVLIISWPQRFLEPVEAILQPRLAVLGVDVSNTPLTPDMMFMYDFRYQKTLYRSKLRFLAREGDETPVELPIRDLSFYGWRVPFILFIELARYQEPLEAAVHALCHETKLRQPRADSFFIESDLEPSLAASASSFFSQ